MAASNRNSRPRAASKTPDKPNITGVDILSLEREEDVPDEPYRFPFKGRVLTINDPMVIDWQEQVKIDPRNVVALMRALMSKEDWEHFRSEPMEGWRLIALFRLVNEYYRTTPEDMGNGGASPSY